MVKFISSNKKIIKSVIISIVYAVLAFAIDRITKNAILLYYLLNNKDIIITNFFSFSLIYNYGISFSFLSEFSRNVIIMLSIASLIILMVCFYKMFDFNKWYTRLAIGFIIGASLGNIYDRIVFGAVIDFINVHYKNYNFPIFNSADTLITFSAIILLYSLVFEKKKEKNEV